MNSKHIITCLITLLCITGCQSSAERSEQSTNRIDAQESIKLTVLKLVGPNAVTCGLVVPTSGVEPYPNYYDSIDELKQRLVDYPAASITLNPSPNRFPNATPLNSAEFFELTQALRDAGKLAM